MIINQIKLSNIELELNRQILTKITSELESDEVQLQLKFQIARSFAQTQKNVFSKVETSSKLCFQREIQLISQKEENVLKAQLQIICKQKSQTFSKSVQLKQVLQLLALQLHSQGQQTIKISFKCAISERNNEKNLSIINPKCQIMKVKFEKQKYLLQMCYLNNNYRTLAYKQSFFWEEPLKMAIKDQSNTITVNLVDSMQRKTKIYQLNVDLFKRKVGSKKILLLNQQKCPYGCFQFDYQTSGFSNLQNQELMPQEYTSEIYKINVVKIKGKFKEPTSQVNIRIVSNISNIDTEKILLNADGFQLAFNKHIYAEQSNCIFMVSCLQNDTEVIGYAKLDLMMLGKFEKRIVINHYETKAVMGHLFVSLEATKKLAKALVLSAICLKLQKIDEKYEADQVMVSARMGCCFGKTQVKPFSSLVNFVKNLQVKYYAQSTLQLRVIEIASNEKLEIEINLSQLQSKISGKYQKSFGNQQDFIKGVISFEYSYDHEKQSLDKKKLKEDNKDLNKIQIKPIQGKQETVSKASPGQIIEKQTQQAKQVFEKKLVEETQQRDKKQAEIQSKIENPPPLLIQTSKQQAKMNKQLLILDDLPKPYLRPSMRASEGKLQLTKKTPKQALLQSTLHTYLLQNHIHQYEKPYKRMKSRKKKVVITPAPEQVSNKTTQNDKFKKSKSKIDPHKRYEFVANVYLGNKIMGLSKNQSVHKKSNSSKVAQFSLNKQAENKNEPQLPKISGQNLNNGLKKGLILDMRLIGRKSISKITKN